MCTLYNWLASLVCNDGSGGSVNHCGVVNGREEPVNQAKLVFREQDRPDCLDLSVGKGFSDTAMATWGVSMLYTPLTLNIALGIITHSGTSL